MESKIQFSRRDLLKSTMAAGLAGAAPVLSTTAQAAEGERSCVR